jgi:hypothetical protein
MIKHSFAAILLITSLSATAQVAKPKLEGLSYRMLNYYPVYLKMPRT